MTTTIEWLGDQQAIRDVLARYWRGIDRRDVPLVASTYHPDAYDDHGYYKGPIDGFLASLEPGVWAYFENTQHFAGQLGIDRIDEDRARVESYAEAHHIRRGEGGALDDLVYGLRYVDRFERRQGEWRIAHRVCTWDWARIDPVGGIPLPESYYRGRHSQEDPVYGHPARSGRRVPPEDLAAKQACADTLARYARGVDRCDPELVRSTYFPDAYDDHGGYQGDAAGFVEWVKPTVMDGFSVTMHKLGNQLIEIDGESAFAETYAIAHHVAADQERPSDMIMGVRYIDRLEQRAGEWKIADRRMSFEWERSLEIGPQDELAQVRRGLRDGHDPVLRSARVAVPADPDRLLDRAAIEAAHVRYCRGVDRRDEALIRSAYHADAHDDHGAYLGDLDGFIEFVSKEVHARFRTTMHKLGQVLIEFDPADPDVAWSEAYAIGHHVSQQTVDPAPEAAPGGPRRRDVADRVMGLRYVDRFERRDGEWRIAERELRYEWIRVDALEPLDPDWTLGTPDADDPVFAG